MKYEKSNQFFMSYLNDEPEFLKSQFERFYELMSVPEDARSFPSFDALNLQCQPATLYECMFFEYYQENCINAPAVREKFDLFVAEYNEAKNTFYTKKAEEALALLQEEDFTAAVPTNLDSFTPYVKMEGMKQLFFANYADYQAAFALESLSNALNNAKSTDDTTDDTTDGN